ncbi:hypothetical protein IQ264_00890 [Phormidium sp. LEGE 05292]|uniref:hypothetical protein n=1 Tax=[Phormidium] sp. LEGE 05292 TaxID=767427 RepID=UPI00187FFE7C|nr:hypothetical protein [Phormidium sp. LEGE 05292]MBE9224031.1 hypothetical protein [Phormidium sp. LEGE 05292]
MLSPEQVATAVQTIDQLSGWLENAGLSNAAIAQFKFNALAAMHPELKEVAELAKSLIGATHSLPEEGMSVTELAATLTENLTVKIKPEQVNTALAKLGYQERNDEKRIWVITEAGCEHGISLLASSKTNKWQGPQLKWYRSVIPILEEYFQQAGNSTDNVEQKNGSSPETEASNSNHSNHNSASNKANAKSKKAWTIAERLKEKGIKSNPDQIQLIQSFADDYYQAKHGTNPPKLTNRRIPVSSYPGEEAIELIDRAIDTVFNPKKK